MLDSSDVEFFDTSVEESPSAKVPGDLRGVQANTATAAPPLSEKTFSDNSIHGFLTGSATLDHTLNLVKEPHDKPRLFICYTLDFKSCSANISDQISMVPRW